jgi:hypothetical protein
MKLLKKYLRKWLFKDYDYYLAHPPKIKSFEFDVETIVVEGVLRKWDHQRSFERDLDLRLLEIIKKYIKTDFVVLRGEMKIAKKLLIAKEKP